MYVMRTLLNKCSVLLAGDLQQEELLLQRGRAMLRVCQ